MRFRDFKRINHTAMKKEQGKYKHGEISEKVQLNSLYLCEGFVKKKVNMYGHIRILMI